jgi:hypothetical protein
MRGEPVHLGQRVALTEIASKQRGHSFVTGGGGVFGRSLFTERTIRKTTIAISRKSITAVMNAP